MSLIMPPDHYQPRALHVPAGKGIVKWVSGDVYEMKATAETTNGSLGFVDARVPPGNGPVAHVHNSNDEAFYIIDGALDWIWVRGPVRFSSGTIHTDIPRASDHWPLSVVLEA